MQLNGKQIKDGTIDYNIDYNIDFIDSLELEFTAPESIKITGVEYLPDDNSIYLTIKVNNNPYTLGNDINYLDTISLTVDDAPCFIKLITENI